MPELTPRQRQVLCLVTLSNREIGMRLGISWQTVKNHHFTDIRRLLGLPAVSSVPARLRLLLRALRDGVVTLDEIEPPPQRLPTGWCHERFAQLHTAAWREVRREWKQKEEMNWPDLHRLIGWLSSIGKRLWAVFDWLFAPNMSLWR